MTEEIKDINKKTRCLIASQCHASSYNISSCVINKSRHRDYFSIRERSFSKSRVDLVIQEPRGHKLNHVNQVQSLPSTQKYGLSPSCRTLRNSSNS